MSAIAQLSLFDDQTRFPQAAYCSDGKGFPARLRRFHLALKKPQIQINPPTLTYWLIFDIDREMGGLAWDYAGLPYPTWSVVNPENGHAHIVYGLEVPVCTSEAARLAPLRYLAAVYSALQNSGERLEKLEINYSTLQEQIMKLSAILVQQSETQQQQSKILTQLTKA